MINRISDLLFKPSTIIQYKDTKFLKTFGFIILLGLLSVLVPIIDVMNFKGYTIQDKVELEAFLMIDFDSAHNLPDCTLHEGTLTCSDDEPRVIGSIYNRLTVVVDPMQQYESTAGELTVLLTKDYYVLVSGYGQRLQFQYSSLPKAWQELDFTAIKAAPYPDDAYAEVIIAGVNELYHQFKALTVAGYLLYGVVMVIFETFFIALIFKLFFRGFGYRFKQVFKVATFAQFMSIVIGLMMTLSGLTFGRALIMSVIRFIYTFKALSPKIYLKNDLE